MDVEGQQIKEEQPSRRHMSQRIKLALTVLNFFVFVVGNTGGPLVLRLYYLHGGHRQWLASWLETGGWPVLFLPLLLSYLYRRHSATTSAGDPAKLILITPRIFLACAAIGLLIGLLDFLYAYGLAFLPVSTSTLLISSQLVFTAFFAFLIVHQRFTPYSMNAVTLLTVSTVMLGLHVSNDRPEGVSRAQYLFGFFLSLGAAALFGLTLPLVELTYRKAKQAITYTLVIEMQVVMAFFGTALCTVGMLVNNDFQFIRGKYISKMDNRKQKFVWDDAMNDMLINFLVEEVHLGLKVGDLFNSATLFEAANKISSEFNKNCTKDNIKSKLITIKIKWKRIVYWRDFSGATFNPETKTIDLGEEVLKEISMISVPHNETDKVGRGGLNKMTLIEIRAMEKRKTAKKYATKIKAKTRRKMHEMANPLEPDEFADLWKE